VDVLGEKFGGIGVTDDYSAYQSQFAKHQLCWSHFLRKAIALALRNPENRQYARFLKSLFAVYYSAVRAARDRRLSSGRAAVVKKLQARIRMICRRAGETVGKEAPADEGKFVRLQNELVENPRNAARTSKTQRGAKRRGIIMSVLASLSKRLERFTLSNLLSEIQRWLEAGCSVFQQELAQLHPATAPP